MIEGGMPVGRSVAIGRAAGMQPWMAEVVRSLRRRHVRADLAARSGQGYWFLSAAVGRGGSSIRGVARSRDGPCLRARQINTL